MGVDLSGYRIVQEALTSTLRHAGPAHARVIVHCASEFVEINVTDDGAGPHGGGPGHGLAGIRERMCSTAESFAPARGPAVATRCSRGFP